MRRLQVPLQHLALATTLAAALATPIDDIARDLISSCWIAITTKPGSAGLYVTSNTNSVREQALTAIAGDWDQIREELNGEVELRFANGRRPIFEEMRSLSPDTEEEVVAWLRTRVNEFVNFFQPRVRANVLDVQQST
jgi:hypothetical protein